MNDLDRLIATVPHGKEKAISRGALAAKMNTTDRRVRQLIEHARNKGVFILNDGDGNGYYQTTDLGELERSYRINKARSSSLNRWLEKMRKELNEAGRQV